MSRHYQPFFKVKWNTPDGQPPASYRRQEPTEPAGEGPPAEELSPAPPDFPPNGESETTPEDHDDTQPVAADEVTASVPKAEAASFHHQRQADAESENEPTSAADEPACDDVTSSEQTDYDEFLTAALDLGVAGMASDDEQPVVKAARRNTQPLSESEEDRFLLCLSYGLSMRQAAGTVRCQHTSMVTRAKRDSAFAQRIAEAKTKARTDPLLEITMAARKSWRAAAWLLTYLDRRDNRGKKAS